MNILDWILGLLGKVLSFFNSFTGNYLLAILLFAVLFKILLFPFSIKQQKSQVKQASLRPKEMAIRNKYKGRDDKVTQQKCQQEVMELYQSEGYSPFGGCLPLLLQFPIIIALYNIIRNPLRYICGVPKAALDVVGKAATALGYDWGNDSLRLMTTVRDHFSDMQAKVAELAGDVDVGAFSSLTPEKLPDFSLFGLKFDLSVTPTIAWNWYLLIPIITFASIFLSSRLMRKLSYQPVDPSMNSGCSNWIMDLAMPAMSTYFSFMFPSLLGVYWIFNNLLGIVQQFILRAMFPAPKFTEEDYKRAEREYKGKAGSRTIENDPRVVPGKKYRSLHHIDDDDAELPVLPLDSRESDSGKAAFADEAPKLKEDKPPRKGKAEETGDDGENAFEKEEIPDSDGESAFEKEEIPDTDGEKTEKTEKKDN